MNIRRALYAQLLDGLQTFPVVALVGPRQVGKTSMAGRIEFLELAPLSLAEVSGPANEANTVKTLWGRGGFPDSYLARSDAASMRWREAFVRSYLERDIPQLGIRGSAATLRRFGLMLAHNYGQLWNASTLVGSLGVPAPSVRHYLDILESTFMVRVLPPFSAHLGQWLVKSPKVYLRDSGLLHAFKS